MISVNYFMSFHSDLMGCLANNPVSLVLIQQGVHHINQFSLSTLIFPVNLSFQSLVCHVFIEMYIHIIRKPLIFIKPSG